jgi:ribosomal protein S7
MKNQKDERIIPNQIIKNYFRKGVKAKGVRRVFTSLVNLKEKQVSTENKRFLAEKKSFQKLASKNLKLKKKLHPTKKEIYLKTKKIFLKKIRPKFKSKKKLKKIRSVKKKRMFPRKKLTIFSKLIGFNREFFSKKLQGFVVGKKKILKKKSKFLRFFKLIRERACSSGIIFKQALSNCRWRVFLRSRWVAGKRMKVPFFSSLLRDTRYACKNFVKSITDIGETPFFPGLLRELYLSLNFKSNTVKKRVVAYRVLYATSLYTSGGYKTVKRRKKINRY